ncbi:serine/threonine protein kinase [Kribbella sp. VKM Ac-2527]|uniref:Serine/threonine protein kinase n=1 Tax=Kribbella caucasensis TaxID=2512215 RepID=A0A4R6K4N6_9ACTN|nr:protein kinase [Kribbella sp. VKM Ac-2527]TDO43402.1 serine/threonine protein kinase [Kribbella sp. VKM Ac-2527]
MALEDIAGYSLRRRLGAGSVGTVWLVRDLASGRHAVLKRIPVTAIPSAEEFHHDLTLAQSINHPHVARLLEIRQTDTDWLLFSQYVAAGTLTSLLQRRGDLLLGELVTLVSPLAQALSVLHHIGLTHGRLAPDNIMFDADGRPVITDPGLRCTAPPSTPADDLTVLAQLTRLAGGDPTTFRDTLFTTDPHTLAQSVLRLSPPTALNLGIEPDPTPPTTPPTPTTQTPPSTPTTSSPAAHSSATPTSSRSPSPSPTSLGRTDPSTPEPPVAPDPTPINLTARRLPARRKPPSTHADLARRPFPVPPTPTGPTTPSADSNPPHPGSAAAAPHPKASDEPPTSHPHPTAAHPPALKPAPTSRSRNPKARRRARPRTRPTPRTNRNPRRTTTRRLGHILATAKGNPHPTRKAYGILAIGALTAIAVLVLGLITIGILTTPTSAPAATAANPTTPNPTTPNPTPPTSSPTAPTTSPSAVANSNKPADWLHLLQSLDQHRAQAFWTLNPTDLDAIYQPGSQPWTADRTLLATYQAQHVRIQGLRMQIHHLTVEQSTPTKVTLRITDRLIAGTAVDPTGHRTSFPPGTPTTRRITLTPAPPTQNPPQTWRITTITKA